MKMYPLKFEAIFKERIWGGQALKEVFGKDIDTGKRIGESWELVDLPDDKSVIINGPLAGKNIAEAIEECGAAITGKNDYAGPLPLLIKILDAQTKLSVQVHPDKATCVRTGKGDPKTECWYIIDAKEGAAIYKGLKAGTTRQEFAAAIENETCADLLERIEVTPGECHFLPSGTAHAIGEGLLIAEIQQPSDTTYRVFDWNRVGDDGKPRQLHVADALESIHFDPSGDDLSVRTDGRLVDSDEFKVDKAQGKAGSESTVAGGEMKVFMIISGTGTITGEDVEDVGFAKGDTLLIPAKFEGTMAFAADTVYLIATV